MTNEQIAVLYAHLLTVPEMVTAISAGNDAAIRDYLNSNSSLYGWRTHVEPDEYLEVMDWTEVDALTVGRARIWEWITSGQTRILNPSRSNIRAGLANAFQGSQAANTRNALLNIAYRLLTVAESLLVVSDASLGTQASPKTMDYEGIISTQLASTIRSFGD